MVSLNVNGKVRRVDVDPSTPLLWVLRDTLGLTGTKFGCGMALCGACTVHLDGEPVRSCSTPASAAVGRKIVDDRGRGRDDRGPQGPGRVDGARRAPVRLLPVGSDHVRDGAPLRKGGPDRCGHRRRHGGHPLSLRDLPAHPRRHPRGGRRQARLSHGISRGPLPPRVPEDDGRRLGRRPRPRHCAARGARRVRGRARSRGDAERLGEDRARQQRDDPLGPLRDGPGRLHRAADAGRRGARGRPRDDPGRDRPGRRALRQRHARGADHRGLDVGARGLRQAAHRRRPGAHDARGRRRRALGRGRVRLPSAGRHGARPGGKARHLRRAGRGGLPAPGAPGREAEGAQGLPLRRQAAQPPRHPRQDQRLGRVRYRRPAARHALRVARAVPGDRRQGGEPRRGKGQVDARREARGAGLGRRRRRGGQLVASQGRPRCAGHQVGRGRLGFAELRRDRSRPQDGRGQAWGGVQEAGRRRRWARGRSEDRRGRLRAALSRPRPAWSR